MCIKMSLLFLEYYGVISFLPILLLLLLDGMLDTQELRGMNFFAIILELNFLSLIGHYKKCLLISPDVAKKQIG